MRTVPPEEYIRVDSYQSMTDGQFTGQEMPPGVVFCEPADLFEFFSVCSRHPYVLVTAQSDYSICEHNLRHPNADLGKLVERISFSEIQMERRDYISLKMGPACDIKKCYPTHQYSVKIDCFTKLTFPGVPANILRWFSCNLDIDHPKVHWLPFGLCHTNECVNILPLYTGMPKKKLLYVNFQENTSERYYLKIHYMKILSDNITKNTDWCWLSLRGEANLPPKDYLSDMAECCFVLCPEGNGLDSYRVYEALYLGCIPVMRDCIFSRHLLQRGLPVLVVDSLFGLTGEFLSEIKGKFSSGQFDLSAITLSDVRARIDRARREL